MTDTITIPPMPDLRCPSSCDRDHLPDWQLHVAVGLDTRPIPAAGGGFLSDNRGPLSEWLEQFEPLHVLPLARIDLERDELAAVQLARGSEGVTYLYVDAEGRMTAEQARTFAAALLLSADRLDEASRADRIDL